MNPATDVSRNFSLTKYYYSHIVEHSEKVMVQSTAFLFSPILRDLEDAERLQDNSEAAQRSCFEKSQPRTIALVALALSTLFAASMLLAKSVFGLAEIARMALNAKERKWEIISLLLVTFVSELSILPFVAIKKAVELMFKILKSPLDGLRELKADVKDTANWLKEYEAKHKANFESFALESMDHRTLKKHIDGQMKPALWKFLKRVLMPGAAVCAGFGLYKHARASGAHHH